VTGIVKEVDVLLSHSNLQVSLALTMASEQDKVMSPLKESARLLHCCTSVAASAMKASG